MKTYFADAFTTEMFTGNPAAVCILEGELSVMMMQRIATEIGFSETSFIQHIAANNYSIRFFTTKYEIPLCGHATLAASKVIFETTAVADIHSLTMEGTKLIVEKSGSQIKMEFPVYGTEKIVVPEAMLTALGITQLTASVYNTQLNMIAIEIEGTEYLRNLQPNFTALVKSYNGINGVLVTAKADGNEFDFHYRYFWPWMGSHEDPVTGAVQTFLTKYWADQLHKTTLNAFQSSGRTGKMTTVLLNDRVFIYGDAVIVLEGNFKINQA